MPDRSSRSRSKEVHSCSRDEPISNRSRSSSRREARISSSRDERISSSTKVDL